MAVDSETLNELLDTVRRYVRERLLPLEQQVDFSDKVPDEIVEEMKEMGFFGLTIPEIYGGMGLSCVEEAAIVQEFGYTAPAFRAVFGTNMGIGSQGLMIDGTDAQKVAYLPKMATGEIIGSFCLTEPEAGSDAASLRMTALREQATYILNGTKRFVSNAPRAGIFTVMARTGTTDERARGISAFIVDASLPGISVGPVDHKMGQRGAHTCDVIFDNVRVPADCLIGGVEGLGFKTAMKVLDRGRLHISALSVGVAKRLIDESLEHTTQRKQFGTEIANFQLIQAMLADSQTEYLAARALVEETARRHARGERVSREASCCKLFCTEMVGRVADRAVQMHGGAGYAGGSCVERLYRDVRLFRIYEGTSQIQQLAIAKSMIRAHQDLR